MNDALASIEEELPGIFDGASETDLGVGLQGYEGGLDWQTALAKRVFSPLTDVDRTRSVWTVLFGEGPERLVAFREDAPPQESDEDIDAIAEAFLSGASAEVIRAKLRRGDHLD